MKNVAAGPPEHNMVRNGRSCSVPSCPHLRSMLATDVPRRRNLVSLVKEVTGGRTTSNRRLPDERARQRAGRRHLRRQGLWLTDEPPPPPGISGQHVQLPPARRMTISTSRQLAGILGHKPRHPDKISAFLGSWAQKAPGTHPAAAPSTSIPLGTGQLARLPN